jgi:hypothetical protein
LSSYSFTAQAIEMRYRIANADRIATPRASFGPVPQPVRVLPFMRRHVRPLANVDELSKTLPAA